MLLPLACSVIVTFAAQLLVAHSLSIFHLFGLLLTVAVGSNYCLFLERSSAGEERGRTVSALVLANLCTVIGFGVLSLSSVPVLQGIGGTVALGCAAQPAVRHGPDQAQGIRMRWLLLLLLSACAALPDAPVSSADDRDYVTEHTVLR